MNGITGSIPAIVTGSTEGVAVGSGVCVTGASVGGATLAGVSGTEVGVESSDAWQPITNNAPTIDMTVKTVRMG